MRKRSRLSFTFGTICSVLLINSAGFAGEAKTITGTNLKQNIVLSTQSIKPLIEKLTGIPFVFIGENHADYANHVKQLEIIKALYEKDKNIAIGMEMFSGSSNKIIADYFQGKISETDFLKNTNYFLEWGYDYQYYKDILDFARKNHIDLIGLNIKNEIVRKIGRTGFNEITEEDFKEIPDAIDFSQESYKKSLNEMFYQHADYRNKAPENFYLSQLIRDEFMAQSAYRYSKENPKKTMIVLVGNGHVEFGYGIPQRLQRMSGKSYKTIMLDSTYKPGAADYFVYTAEIKMTSSPRLKITLSSEEGKMIVGGFPDKETEDKHVLKKKDEILKVNETVVKSIADIRLLLYDKKPGDVIDISIIRDKQPMSLKYTLEAEENDNQ